MKITEAFIREYEALVRTVKGINGPGVQVLWGKGVSIRQPQKRTERPTQGLPFGLMLRVNVSQTGGVAGSKTTACTFTYSVTSLAGVSLGTGVSPEMARPSLGKMTAGTRGMGYYDSTGTFKLTWVDEVKGAVACS